ncbi:peptidoglycan-binding protein [Streptomyces sioyaensis]|uniref:peptidoglycan-binding protein n=1 Tax=Streptomyces sioyaensis TaxID=67364 RepID=UPI003D716D89
MAGVEAMIAQAEKSIGLGEPNYIQSWYPGLSGNFAWCNAAITYWAWHSDNQQAVTWGGYYAYTVAHAQRFKDLGQWHVDIAGIRRGDIVFFDWGQSNSIAAIDHVGIVTSVSGGTVYTIEGNTSDRCLRRVRDASTIAGYGRPNYLSAPKPPPPAPTPASKFVPFPGTSWFSMGRKSPIVLAMHKRLVAVGCNRYETTTNKDVIGTGDVASYEAWQRRCGFTGDDAKWPPGKETWDRLHVPK